MKTKRELADPDHLEMAIDVDIDRQVVNKDYVRLSKNDRYLTANWYRVIC